MTTLVTILNGPPSSGKDTLADMLVEAAKAGGVTNTHHLRFKDVLYQETAEHFDVPVGYLIEVASDTIQKEKPLSALQGKTPREALIHVSENIIKPLHGDDYFGKKTKEKMLSLVHDNELNYFVISDSGFYEELAALCGSHIDDLLFLKIEREGCSFKGDSRKYLGTNVVYAILDYNGVGESIVDEVDNNGSKEDLNDYAVSLLEEEVFPWKYC